MIKKGEEPSQQSGGPPAKETINDVKRWDQTVGGGLPRGEVPGNSERDVPLTIKRKGWCRMGGLIPEDTRGSKPLSNFISRKLQLGFPQWNLTPLTNLSEEKKINRGRGEKTKTGELNDIGSKDALRTVVRVKGPRDVKKPL